ncbi:MAG: hypothetical protein J0M02_11715 [Planctomycetes bacterium]|nr:hypothetical protein [Planctomycetota bacterium]
MRTCAAWLACAALAAAAAAPTIVRPATTVLRYDVMAEDPWLPLLWEPVQITLPGSPCGLRVSAELYKPSDTYAVSNADLLTLRGGNGVVLDGLTLTVAGLPGTWSGLRSGSAKLVATLPAGADAGHALLLMRQLCFGNLARAASSSSRRVRVILERLEGETATASAPLTVNLALKDQESLPLIRFDPLPLTVGAPCAWRPVAWYDSRPATPMTWLLLQTPAPPADLHVIAHDAVITPALCSPPSGADGHPMADFAARDLRLLADQAGTRSLAVRALNRSGTTLDHLDVTMTTVATGAAVGGVVIGDIPLAVTPGLPVSTDLRTSLPGAWSLDIEAHPRGGAPPPAEWFTLDAVDDSTLRLTITAGNAGRELLCGILVLRNGDTVVRLPFRIVSDPGTGG